ncbi:hypothetical protein Hanom_Chr06g00578731 [Helianthus anomalus]
MNIIRLPTHTNQSTLLPYTTQEVKHLHKLAIPTPKPTTKSTLLICTRIPARKSAIGFTLELKSLALWPSLIPLRPCSFVCIRILLCAVP